MITEEQKSQISNGILIGLDKNAAYAYAGLNIDQMNEADDDAEIVDMCENNMRQLEFDLLSTIHNAMPKQAAKGETHAAMWLLEKLFPRYSQKAAPDLGEVTLVFNTPSDTSDILSVEGARDPNYGKE